MVESTEEKNFVEKGYDKTFTEKEIDIIDKIIVNSMGKNRFISEKGINNVLLEK